MSLLLVIDLQTAANLRFGTQGPTDASAGSPDTHTTRMGSFAVRAATDTTQMGGFAVRAAIFTTTARIDAVDDKTGISDTIGAIKQLFSTLRDSY